MTGLIARRIQGFASLENVKRGDAKRGGDSVLKKLLAARPID